MPSIERLAERHAARMVMRFGFERTNRILVTASRSGRSLGRQRYARLLLYALYEFAIRDIRRHADEADARRAGPAASD